MSKLSWWIEWPLGMIRVGVVFLVGVALLAALVRLPGVVRDLDRDASRGSALSFSDREIAGGNGVVADQAAVYQARGLIPPDETYHVVIGADYAGGSDLTVPFVESYYTYFLMPRRPTEDASWIICYGCDLGQYAAVEIVWQDDAGISIAKVQR